MIGRAAWNLYILAKALTHPVAFGTAGAVFDDQGRVLLVLHRYMPGWQLPGGGVDRRETPAMAVRRELSEEVGLTGGSAEFFGLYSAPAGIANHVVTLFRVTGAAIAFRPSLEISAIQFVDPRRPPPGCTGATLRRLAELAGTAPVSPWW